MSGLWSFREPTLSAVSTSSGARNAYGPTPAVTRVLPTGVEYQKTLRGNSEKDALTESPITAPSLTVKKSACSVTGGPSASGVRETQGKRRGECESRTLKSETTGTTLPTALLDEAQRTLSDECYESADCGVVADVVDRDEAAREVQREWWRTLNVDVAPAFDLSMCGPSTDENTQLRKLVELDEETKEIAHSLLLRAALANTTGDGGASGTAASTCVTNDAKVMSSKRVQHNTRSNSKNACVTKRVQQKRAHCERHVRSGKTTSAPRGALPPPQTQVPEKGQDAPPHAGVSGSATAAAPCDKIPQQSMALDPSQTGEGEGRAETLLRQDCLPPTSTVTVQAASTRNGPSNFEERSGKVQHSSTCADQDTTHTVHQSVFQGFVKNTEASEALRKAMAVAANTAPLMPCAAGSHDAMCALVDSGPLLKHYFTLWLTAAEERQIQRSATSYHDHLMQCVRDALREATKTVEE